MSQRTPTTSGLRPRPEIEALTAYRLRREALVKLNQNESPWDWPPELKDEVLRRVATRPWNRYPPVDAEALRQALAEFCGVSPTMIAVTNGSNEAILALVITYATGRRVVVTAPGYSMVVPLAVIGGATVQAVPLCEDFSLDAPAMVAAVSSPEVAVTIIASPNNPTGNAFARPSLTAVLESARGLVVIDEAYAQFTAASFVGDLSRYAHLAIVRTFSKGFALAGVRVGWIIASGEVLDAVRKALPPYNVNVFSQEAALVALQRPELVSGRVEALIAERRRLEDAVRAIDGVTTYPSEANFLLVRTRAPAADVFAGLLERGVLVRDVSRGPLLENCLRVTVGTHAENNQFLDALRASVGGRSA
ncbi:MAG TPA: histidinol-phosphate transaminase [bacterium]|nr:histidinol-phosphate transaminase [bacterium]